MRGNAGCPVFLERKEENRMLVVTDIRVPLGTEEQALSKQIANQLKIDADRIQSVRLLRKSLDARKKQDIHYLIHAVIAVDDALEKKLLHGGSSHVSAYRPAVEQPVSSGTLEPKGRIIVVGLGPAGLFAAHVLAKHGYQPLVIERGRPIQQRVSDVDAFWSRAVLSQESNVMFGEGGAGTFSDGKLTTRIKDSRADSVLRLLVEHGAPKEIPILAKPHIGTDRLRTVVAALRKSIEELGGEVWFSAKLCGIETQNGGIRTILVQRGSSVERICCAALVLAIGQGARDTYRMLAESGIAMQPKPFAVGVRVEHPQSMIDRVQYGAFAGDPRLGAAEYRLSSRSNGRGVYTFCMCPGGFVVASASDEGQVVVNGMSNYARDAENANAAIVVQVAPEDFSGTDALSGVRFCEKLEHDAYLAGGGSFYAPAERIADFLAHDSPHGFGGVRPTYRPGVAASSLWNCLPDFVAEGIADGIRGFSRNLRGFDLQDGVLTAVESRTSAPLRILRGENGESLSHGGIYPVGEGAGYAGGIVSAAVDGMRAAERIIGRFRAPACG